MAGTEPVTKQFMAVPELVHVYDNPAKSRVWNPPPGGPCAAITWGESGEADVWQ